MFPDFTQPPSFVHNKKDLVRNQFPNTNVYFFIEIYNLLLFLIQSIVFFLFHMIYCENMVN